MANLLYVGEHLPIVPPGPGINPLPLLIWPILRMQELDIVATSQFSDPFSGQTGVIRVWADIDCFVDVAVVPAVDTNGSPIRAGVPECFLVSPGMMLAVKAKV